MSTRRKHALAESAPVSLSSSYTAIRVGVATGDNVAPIPDQCELSLASLELTSIVTATHVDWYISEDADGDIPLTPVKSNQAIVGQTSGKGGVADSLDVSYARSDDGTPGSVYIWAKLNAGTATAVGRIRFADGG